MNTAWGDTAAGWVRLGTPIGQLSTSCQAWGSLRDLLEAQHHRAAMGPGPCESSVCLAAWYH